MKYVRPLVKLPSSYRILLALLLFRWLLIPDEEVAAASVSGSKRLNMGGSVSSPGVPVEREKFRA